MTLALVNPVVPGVEGRGGRGQLPVAGVRAAADQLGRAPVAQGEAGSLRVDAGAAPAAHGQAHAPVARNVHAVDAALLGRERRARRVHSKYSLSRSKRASLTVAIPSDRLKRDAVVAQSDDAQDGVAADAQEVARVNLNFEARVRAGRGEHVALHEREVDACALPVLAAVAAQLHVAAGEADARDARRLVVFFVVSVVGANRAETGREGEQDGEQEETGDVGGPRVPHGLRSFEF